VGFAANSMAALESPHLTPCLLPPGAGEGFLGRNISNLSRHIPIGQARIWTATTRPSRSPDRALIPRRSIWVLERVEAGLLSILGAPQGTALPPVGSMLSRGPNGKKGSTCWRICAP